MIKKLICLISIVFLSNNIYSKEIELLCTGQETHYKNSLLFEKSAATYTIIFDDVKKTIPIMTQGLILGCFQSEHTKSIKCDCQVTDRELKCEAALVGITNKSYQSKQSFVLNRYSGKMNNFNSSTSTDENSQNIYYSTTGELDCKAMTKRKF